MEDQKPVVMGVEALMVQEYLALKEKVAKLEKENADLKKAYATTNRDRDILLQMVIGGYSQPDIRRDADGHVEHVYSSGGSISCPRSDTCDQSSMDRIAKLIEDKIEKTNNKEEK